MNDETALSAALHHAFNGSACRCAIAAGLWIVELVLPSLNAGNRQTILTTISQQISQINQQPIWKIFLYTSQQDRFTESGTLHTRWRTYSAEGFPTTYLDAKDTFLNVTEFDSEVLMIEPLRQQLVLGIETISDNTGQPILPFHQKTDYLWLEANGCSYNIRSNGVTRNTIGVVEIVLGSRP